VTPPPGIAPAAVRTDVAVIGAGPAGSWAAYCLARRGARVTIFDPSHPREKPCGGGVTGRALALLGDAIDLSGLQSSAVTHARFLHGPHESAVVPLAGDALVITSREDFDAALLDAAREAGATLVTARVGDVVLERNGVRIDTSHGAWRAPFVIGADGANSLVRRRLARPFRRDELSIATGFFAHGVTSHEIVIELVDDPPGYLWSFPRPSHLAIGICAQADAGSTAQALRDRAARWIRDTGLAEGARLQAYSWPIPSLTPAGVATVDLAGERWCLAGDAAGLVDPITREGIYFALQSGQWAAESLEAGHATANYARRVRTDILSELARAARMKAGFFRPAFTGLMFRALQQSAAIRSVMADLVAGQQPYAGLRRRLLSTLELGLAWKVFVRMGRGTIR
jgi:geranylgeranyl reductase family protein